MSESLAERRKMPLLFTTVDGDVFELDPKDLPPRVSELHPNGIATPETDLDTDPIQTLDGPSERVSSGFPKSPRTPRSRCGTPLIEIVAADMLPAEESHPGPKEKVPHKQHARTKSGTVAHNNDGVKIPMLYNEYGELVPASSINEHPKSENLTVIQLLRVIRKAYHHDLWSKLSKLLNPHPDGGDSVLSEDNIWSYRLSSWDLRLRTPKSASPSSVASQSTRAYGQRRVLELGVSDGDWCFAFKKQQPDWIVHGVDDTNHWACFDRGAPLRDFMSIKTPKTPGKHANYFSGVLPFMSIPEFTERNLNCLLMHEHPFPENHYEFIRGRGIFERVESYKTFLEDVRRLLKPDGVIEFIEVDPRPRLAYIQPVVQADELEIRPLLGQRKKKRSTAATDWTDKIEDRFTDPLDREVAVDVVGWSARVAERLKANLRPREGVAAPQLKSWLEGAGFWDVKQFVLPIPVGGPTKSGNLLKEYLLYKLQLENSIPKLQEELPQPEIEEMQTGKYHLNVHIVTARKPMDLRTGDLMPNGERKEMNNSTYDAMAKFDAIKSSQWKRGVKVTRKHDSLTDLISRFDLEGNLEGIIQNLTTLTGAPEALSLNRGTPEDGLIIGRHPDHVSPFNAPPFVTYKEMEDHIAESGSEKDPRALACRTGLPRLG